MQGTLWMRCVVFFVVVFARQTFALPNILFIVADDYGYNDVGYHGSEISTPNLDALAKEGVKLENYYVSPLCSPSRGAFLSGRFPIKTGLQNFVISPAKPYGLHLQYTTLADALRAAGYSTHIVGKWHLGYCREEFFPMQRGFDSFYGYVNGEEHYFTHVRGPNRVSVPNFSAGYDYWRTENGKEVVNWAPHGSGPPDNIDPALPECYSAHDLAYHAIQVVQNHPMDTALAKPLFLYLAFQSVHEPIEAPQKYVDEYQWMRQPGYRPVSPKRQTYAGMVAAMDEAIQNVTRSFKSKDVTGAFWNNTLMVFTTDNGGIGPGNNYPLRGGKASVFEGGTRGVAFVHGYGLKRIGYSNHQMMHAVDWFPTLLHASLGAESHHLSHLLKDIDGVSVWEALSDNQTSPRSQFVYNINTIGKGTKLMLGGAVRMGCYKLIVGFPGLPFHDQKPQRKPSMQHDHVASIIPFGNQAEASLDEQSDNLDGFPFGTELEAGLGEQLQYLPEKIPVGTDFSLLRWIYNVCVDPSERHNLYGDGSIASVQQQLLNLLEEYRREMVPALYNIYPDDPRANPKLHNGTWAPWGCDATGARLSDADGRDASQLLV